MITIMLGVLLFVGIFVFLEEVVTRKTFKHIKKLFKN